MTGPIDRRTFLATAAIGLTGCVASQASPSLNEENVQQANFELVTLPYDQWPSSNPDRQYYSPEEVSELPDLKMYRGESGATHALQTSRQLNLVAQSIRHADSTGVFEDAADRLTDAYVETATGFKNALFFPYEFEFNVHGNPAHKLPSPWYSGMAQGLSLGTFARLYHLTGRDRYAQLAERTYKSITDVRLPTSNSPWVSTIDDEGYFWIEEYPMQKPAHTLNGKIFAIYGLYEYWRATGRDDVAVTTREAMTTVRDHLPEFRKEGGVSRYCLTHDVTAEGYHQIHVRQFRQLDEMTAGTAFGEWADRYQSDFWTSKE
ncbi:D-glucuronyl C5-epimerase family protein [Halobacterium salinarum]|uniref:D-glucuronyl C5-epimerase C-terminus n=2 Tax=Halobacterium salinarum TaxID=2242 RepID=A0A4D6GQN4_HALS9|nr:glycoside hydrolase family protein [Halobacterium salinarum]TYO71778.1 D-glucuronyl C5-epimerase C-terminus [Halobacterium salinarum DSM 3754]